jgi:hypothetical protein
MPPNRSPSRTSCGPVKSHDLREQKNINYPRGYLIKALLTKSNCNNLLVATILLLVNTVQADNFIYPQAVYIGEDVELTEYPNGAIVNKAMWERSSTTQLVQSFIKELAEGVWAIVGYHWGCKAVIDGEKGLIIYRQPILL